MFQGLRQHSPIFILEKGEKPIIKIGYVETISNPMPRFGQSAIPVMGQQVDTIVDVSAKVGDDIIDLKKLPANQSFATLEGNANVCVSDSREVMISEVENMLRASNSVLDSIPYHKSVVSASEDILKVLNPQLAKEQEQEKKIGALESEMKDIKSSLGKIDDKFETLLKALKSGSPKTKE